VPILKIGAGLVLLDEKQSRHVAQYIELRVVGGVIGRGLSLASAASSQPHCCAGSHTVKVVPCPTSLFTSIRPPCSWTMLWLTYSPSPSPCCLVL
jgi:hypothetical protein